MSTHSFQPLDDKSFQTFSSFLNPQNFLPILLPIQTFQEKGKEYSHHLVSLPTSVCTCRSLCASPSLEAPCDLSVLSLQALGVNVPHLLEE